MKIPKIGNLTLWRVLTAVFILLLVIGIAGNVVTRDWSGYINKLLGVSGTTIVTEEDDTADPTHFKSEFSSYTETMNNARAVAKAVQGEGTVLMTNRNDALPLAKGAMVTFMSYSSVDVAYGGTGSGGVTADADREIDLVKACANDGKLDLNRTMFDFYQAKLDSGWNAKNGAITRKTGGGWGDTTAVAYAAPEVPASEFPTAVTESFDTYKDAAIFVLTRVGGEGNDLITSSAQGGADKYLALTDDEKSVLKAMKDGPFAKRIVLVNTFNAPELGWLDEYGIDACLYIGGPGEVGLDAVTDILVGETNPSGKLADTYAYDSFSSPAMQNFGDFTFTNAADVANPDSTKYLMYNEGIYVGYRYYETRYEDCVLKRDGAATTTGAFASADKWTYSEEVQFPFGWGLSYTDFTQTLTGVAVNEADKTATVSVTVTNAAASAGGVTGKDVVEVYAQAPYTAGGVEKAAVQLVGFAKTGEIEPGKSETVSVTVNLNDLASYDYKNHRTYVLEAGDYYFAIGNGAHDALNNILAKKGASGTDAAGVAAKAEKWTKGAFDADEYMLSATKKKVTNRFAATDINYYAGGSDIVTYLSRNDWSATWPKNMTGFAATDRMLKDISDLYDKNNNPAAYTPGDRDTSSVTLGAEQKYSVAMMIGADYDDAAWELLLDQITLKEMAHFCAQGRPAIESVNMPETTAVDGPAAWTKSTYKEKYDDYGKDAKKTEVTMVLYPTETVIASTWNVALTNELGISFGEEGLWGGGVGWYGPAANIHRTPYAGRNFEYFSEDGFISGKLAEAETKGAMSKGTIPYLKHFLLNDQETNRIGVCTFANEQSLREVYLRAFQYAFETTGADDKACTGVMGAFNRLGVTWTGHHAALWQEVMAGEWGFTGNVTTDFGQKPQTLMDPLLAYEAGTTMFCTSGASFENIIAERAKTDLKLLTNMREATHRILYNFANSAALNGLTSDSRIVPVMTWYNIALLLMIIISAVLAAASAAMLTAQTFFRKEEA